MQSQFGFWLTNCFQLCPRRPGELGPGSQTSLLGANCLLTPSLGVGAGGFYVQFWLSAWSWPNSLVSSVSPSVKWRACVEYFQCLFLLLWSSLLLFVHPAWVCNVHPNFSSPQPITQEAASLLPSRWWRVSYRVFIDKQMGLESWFCLLQTVWHWKDVVIASFWTPLPSVVKWESSQRQNQTKGGWPCSNKTWLVETEIHISYNSYMA